MKRTTLSPRLLLAVGALAVGPVVAEIPASLPGDLLLYLPTRDEPATPATWGFDYDELDFPSADGTSLHGWLIHARGKRAKGCVVFSHGTAGSVGHHLGLVMWLAEAGYHVLAYDYRGFGKSGGSVSRNGMVEDARAAITHATRHPLLKSLPLVSYGHSMGGAKSVAAIASAPPGKLRAVVIDGTFSSYRDIAVHMGGTIGGMVVSDTLSPIDHIAAISPLPLLVIHGRSDEIVPFSQGLRLYQAAREPKTFFDIADGRHGDSLARDNGTYRKRMLAWLDKVLVR